MTITAPRHAKSRPAWTARFTPAIASHKAVILGGAALSLPATAAGSVLATADATTVSGTQATVKTTANKNVVWLRYGSQGSLVKVVQQRLGGLNVDGDFGPATLAAVKAFQTSHHLYVDGIVGPYTWAALGGFPGTISDPPTTPKPPTCSVTVLRYGSSGALVKVAQQRLGVAADGSFGPGTLARVKSYQAGKGLSVTGAVDGATWSALGGFPCDIGDSGGSGGGSSPSGVSAVISIAKQYLGVPYVYGGATPSGFDCSGLTQYVYAKAGMSLPRTAAAQQSYLRSTSNPVPGDLVFFGFPAYHVGIYMGPNQMLAAPYPGQVVRIQPIYNTPSGYGHYVG